ncbi:MAG: hypothetical protein ACI8QC_001490 [Planctomycetota bacterium]|jgi:hypothetical protein
MKLRIALLTVSLAALALAAPADAQSDFKESYVSDIQAFCDQADEVYPFFELKGIEKQWGTAKSRLLKSAKKCKTDADFMQLIFDGIGQLRDAHSYVTESAIELPKREPSYYSGLSLMQATDGRVVVMFPPQGQGASLKAGTVVLKIDGKDAAKFLEKRTQETWAKGGSFSSPQRARIFEYLYALSGEKGDKHTLECLAGKKRKKVKLTIRTEKGSWAHNYNWPEDLVKAGKSFYYKQLESGVGYMYLRRIDSSIPTGMAEALKECPDAGGWIIDLRGNTGGGYGDDLRKQIEATPGPVALIIDAGCISAGETVARDFKQRKQARIFGSTSAGSSSSKRTWELPSGAATIRFSVRGYSGLDGHIIEYRGIVPDEEVLALPEDVAAGENTQVLRAEAYLLKGK